jgi:adenylate cyclase
VGVEIERKFLVNPARLGPLEGGESIRQGYIAAGEHAVVRARLASDRAWLTLKGRSRGAARSEFEYSIPPEEARQIIDELCSRPVIAKTRYRREYRGHTWEIDVFEAENAGLIVAEVELADESEEPALPDWVEREVTGDARYYNASLVQHPFSEWR